MVVHRNKTRTGWLGGAPAVNPDEAGGYNLPAANFERLASRVWSVVNKVGRAAVIAAPPSWAWRHGVGDQLR